MKIIFSLLLCFSCATASAQNGISFQRKYDPTKLFTLIDAVYFSIPNTIFITLCEGFDDSLHITVNENTLMDGHFKTDASTGLTGSFGSFNDSAEVKILQIEFVHAKRFLREASNLKYKLLEIGHYYNCWNLLYTNHWKMRE